MSKKEYRTPTILGAVTVYKGYGIDFNIYGRNEYSVQIDGDDIIFNTLKEAKNYIDNISE